MATTSRKIRNKFCTCGGEIMISFNAYIEAPFNMFKRLTKNRLQDKRVTLRGVDWDKARAWCNKCGASWSLDTPSVRIHKPEAKQ